MELCAFLSIDMRKWTKDILKYTGQDPKKSTDRKQEIGRKDFYVWYEHVLHSIRDVSRSRDSDNNF